MVHCYFETDFLFLFNFYIYIVCVCVFLTFCNFPFL